LKISEESLKIVAKTSEEKVRNKGVGGMIFMSVLHSESRVHHRPKVNLVDEHKKFFSKYVRKGAYIGRFYANGDI
jgi:hypothetical protein